MVWRNPDTDQEEVVVVVAGGHNTSVALTSSERLFLNNAPLTWKAGPELPCEIEFANMLELENTLILFNGETFLKGPMLDQNLYLL